MPNNYDFLGLDNFVTNLLDNEIKNRKYKNKNGKWKMKNKKSNIDKFI